MKTTRPHTASKFSVEPNDLIQEQVSETLVHYLEGLSRFEIAEKTHKSPRTVKEHLTIARDALGASNSASLVAMAFYHNLVRIVCTLMICLQIGLVLVATQNAVDVRRAPRTGYNMRISARSGRTRREDMGHYA